MRLIRVSVLAGLTVLATDPAAAATFGELEAWCAPPEKSGRPALCSGYLETYLQGLASTKPSLNAGNRVCVPETKDRGELIRALRAYASENPSSRKLPGVVGLGRALRGYPCR